MTENSPYFESEEKETKEKNYNFYILIGVIVIIVILLILWYFPIRKSGFLGGTKRSDIGSDEGFIEKQIKELQTMQKKYIGY